MRLTAKQREHLGELLRIEENGTTGEAFWTPTGSAEHSSARALAGRGLLTLASFNPMTYALTDRGRKAARSATQDTPGEGA